MGVKAVYVELADSSYINGYLAVYEESFKKIANSKVKLAFSKTAKKDDNIIKLVLNKDYEVVQVELFNEETNSIQMPDQETHISGIYPGSFRGREKEFEKLSEAHVYFMIKQSIDQIHNLNNEINNALIKSSKSEIDKLKKQKRDWEYAFDFGIARLGRFGVEQQFDIETKRMVETESFKTWYKTWTEYFNYVENDNNLYLKFASCKRQCLDLTEFSPKTYSYKKN